VDKEMNREIKKFCNLMKIKTKINKIFGTQKGSAKRKVYSYGCLHLNKSKRLQINNLMVNLKFLGKQEQVKSNLVGKKK
jgi:hypothetical protein